ncbi:hypothetical protein TanjilG_19274 [Lupinus angustifolius]|uniref:F-box domain-containing protein n=2 Tax=Lupinus angustifolius TaxID=3871 RepID=A0A1J7HYA3_LUPAN|nr:hypothetical protein TanjilG_19274 [Lupinus angustifolius]
MGRQQARRVVDRISSLSDELICYILSFLMTKDAVVTSVLSKRWYPLWRSVPIINLSDEHVTDEETCLRFGQFVFSVLLSRDVMQAIKRFRLKSVYKGNNYSNNQNLNKWVSLVLDRRVEHLELLVHTVPKLFPMDILSCRTLVVLKLSGFRKVNENDVSSVELPSLKILHLGAIGFRRDRCLLRLLSGCPNLEDFKVISVVSASHDSCEEFKSLTKLIRAEILCCNINFIVEALYNVQYLFLRVNKEVSVYSNHLPVFSNLTRMVLSFDKYMWRWLVKMLKHCPKLQILEVIEIGIGDFDENWVCPKFVPECVSLQLRDCAIRGFEGSHDALQFARYIMGNASALQTMRIYSNKKLGSNAKVKVNEKLSQCKKHSATCQLYFFN